MTVPPRADGGRASRRAALLFNPRAGQGRGARTLGGIVAELERAFELEPQPTEGPRHCRELARDAVRRGLDAVFVLGGDGSARIAASQLVGTATALGALPGGTTNVVAGALGLPADPVAAARALVSAPLRELDAGVVRSAAGESYFLMQLSGGLDARVLAAVDLRWKRRVGKLAIGWAGGLELLRYRFPAFELEIDGERRSATGFVVANLAQYAGQFAIVPGARADDRQLDLLLFHGTRRRDAVGFAVDLARGKHATRGDVEILRPQRIVVTGPERLLLQGDGDWFEAAPPFEIALAEARLQILAPAAAGRVTAPE